MKRSSPPALVNGDAGSKYWRNWARRSNTVAAYTLPGAEIRSCKIHSWEPSFGDWWSGQLTSGFLHRSRYFLDFLCL
jgi:hypothetical protein